MYTRLLVIATALLLERRTRLAAGLATAAGVTQGRRGDTSKTIGKEGDADNERKKNMSKCTAKGNGTNLGAKGELTAKSMCFSLSTRTR